MVFCVDGVCMFNMLFVYWWGKLMIGVEYVLLQCGLMLMVLLQLGVFVKLDLDDFVFMCFDFQYYVQLLLFECFGELLYCFNVFMVLVCYLWLMLCGSVYVMSVDLGSVLVIVLNYLLIDYDWYVVVNVLCFMCWIVFVLVFVCYCFEEILLGL